MSEVVTRLDEGESLTLVQLNFLARSLSEYITDESTEIEVWTLLGDGEKQVGFFSSDMTSTLTDDGWSRIL